MSENERAAEDEAAEGAPGGGSAAASNAAAVGVALGGTRAGKLAPEAAAYLASQKKLVDLQMEHLHEERALQHRHMRLKFFGDRLKVALQLLTIAAGGAIAIGAAVVVWNDAHADGLVIKPFSVPPALAARGITGAAVASGLADRISLMEETARSSQNAQKEISADTGEHIAIEIPETGISLAQVDQWLRDKLGHERRVSGEVMAAPDGGLTLAIRIGGHAFPALTGAETDLPALLQRAVEAIDKREQPNRYDRYLALQHRSDDRLAFARERTTSPSRAEQAAGYGTLGDFGPAGLAQAAADYRRAIAIDPGAVEYAYDNLAAIETVMGHPEAALALRRRFRVLLRDPANFPALSAEARRQQRLFAAFNEADAEHDNGLALKLAIELSHVELLGFVPSASFQFNAAGAQVALHDLSGARATLTAFAPRNEAQRQNRQASLDNLGAPENLNASLAALEAAEATYVKQPAQGAAPPVLRSNHAIVLARLERLGESQAMIDATPLDCAPCINIRGQIAELAGDRPLADHWFGEYLKMTPSLAVPPMLIGNALLARGEAERAAAQFDVASQRAPHWADPMSLWGAALLKQGKARAAIAKFREADKYAPRWGRNHMLWGEALAKQGKTAEAKVQFTAAAGMDLTAAEKAELQGQAHG